MRSRHFVRGNFRSQATHMSDKEYAKVLDNIVVACVDCIIVNLEGKMLLVRRVQEPLLGWSVPGGRMLPGESFEDTAARKVKDELDLTISPDRFQQLPVGATSWVFDTRAQEPQDYGCHMIGIEVLLRITREEITAIQLTKDHEDLQWLDPQKIVPSYPLHPAVRQYAQDLIGCPKK